MRNGMSLCLSSSSIALPRCSTCVSVAWCSKEPSLEDKIQSSLRENLKEIGHRCIQEMREFIDRLKDEDIDDVWVTTDEWLMTACWCDNVPWPGLLTLQYFFGIAMNVAAILFLSTAWNLGILFGPYYWHCSHSMRSRVYETVERPSVCPSISLPKHGQKLCCCGPPVA